MITGDNYEYLMKLIDQLWSKVDGLEREMYEVKKQIDNIQRQIEGALDLCPECNTILQKRGDYKLCKKCGLCIKDT